jgi:hypothetical protein
MRVGIRIYDDIGWPIWSPNGNYFVALPGPYLCIISLDKQEDCYPVMEVESGYGFSIITWLNWSLDGELIAFVLSEYPKSLIVFSTSSHEFITIHQSEGMTVTFWK